LAVLCALVLVSPLVLSHEGHLPAGFQKTTVFSSLSLPTAARFAPDGRAFVIEKYGNLYAYDSVSDTTPTLVKNFESQLWSYHDHGLLGLAVDPQLEAWCLIYPSHGMGDLQFGPDGSLYVTVGDAASFNNLDWGQDEPYNADGDPSGGCTCNDPFEEGGALRALASSPTVSAIRSGSPSIRRPARSSFAMSAGTSGKRSTISPTRSPRPSRTLAGPATKAQG
jgi:hypothetical protein